jgi:hypothetical protein
MSKIADLLDSLDIGKLLPNLESILSKVSLIAVLAVMIGPLLLLGLGLLYYFAPPKEANHKAGFRTYFGMGSVQAWRFTQRIAGMALGGLGAVLTVVMFFVCLSFGGLEPVALMERAVICLLWEAGLAAVAYLAVVILVTVTYDKNGYRRK